MSRVVAIIQARLGSTRLPGKVLLPIAGKPMLWHVVERTRGARLVDEVVVATSDLADDDAIAAFGAANSVPVFRGSETDVLDRYYRAALEHNADAVVRVTGDCPLLAPEVTDAVVAAYENGHYDHVGATAGSAARALGWTGFPEGAGSACFSMRALEESWSEAVEPDDREHVATYMLRHPERFKCLYISPREDRSHLRWTVDTVDDLEMVRAVYGALFHGSLLRSSDVLDYMSVHPEVPAINGSLIGTEKYGYIWDELKVVSGDVRIVEFP